MRGRNLAALILASLWMTPVQAQWTDSFESYADGSVLDGQGGWHGWDGIDSNNARVASLFASDGSQCLQVLPGCDSIQEFDGFDSGKWTVAADLYIPSSFVGRVYFILMNSYQNGGPYQWSGQIAIDGDFSEMQCFCGSGAPAIAPLVHDTWVELRCEVDLDGDLVEVYYADVLMGSYAWSAGPFGGGSYGLLQVDAVDIFSDSGSYPHTTELYFDNFRVTPQQGAVGTGFCFGDGLGGACPCGNSGAVEEGCQNSTGQGAILTAVGSPVIPADDIVFQGSQLPALKSAMLFAGPDEVNGGNGFPFGDGLRCAGGSIKRLDLRTTDAVGEVSYGPGLGAIGGWIAGDTRRFQIWCRDPQGGPCAGGFNLSNGLEIFFIP